MAGFFKDDLTVALDDVDRLASRMATVYYDLRALATQPETAALLEQRSQRLEAALGAFNEARRKHGQAPEVEEPERGHLEALWFKLKSVLAENSAQALKEAMEAWNRQLEDAVAQARRLNSDADIDAALEQLTAAATGH